jgi:uncharacterized phiE125 gp8 family phage protein
MYNHHNNSCGTHRLLTRITAPASEPVTLAQAKTYLRIDGTTEDTIITDMIVASRMTAENWLRRSLINQVWKLGYDDMLPESVYLPMGPVNSITSVTIINRDASTQAVNSTGYYLNTAKTALMFDSAPGGFHIEIVYNAGYSADASGVPMPIRQGMLSHIASMYDSRGEQEQNAIPEQTLSLFAPFREVML